MRLPKLHLPKYARTVGAVTLSLLGIIIISVVTMKISYAYPPADATWITNNIPNLIMYGTTDTSGNGGLKGYDDDAGGTSLCYHHAVGQPLFLTNETGWLSIANQPSTGAGANIPLSNGQTQIGLQVNTLTMACAAITSSVPASQAYAPNDVASGWSGWTNTTQQDTTTYIDSVDSVSAVITGTSTAVPGGSIDSSTPLAGKTTDNPANYRTKYWPGTTIPFTYDLPSGGITQPITVTISVTTEAYNTFLSGGVTSYECVGGSVSQSSAPTGQPGACPEVTGGLSMSFTIQPQYTSTCGTITDANNHNAVVDATHPIIAQAGQTSPNTGSIKVNVAMNNTGTNTWFGTVDSLLSRYGASPYGGNDIIPASYSTGLGPLGFGVVPGGTANFNNLTFNVPLDGTPAATNASDADGAYTLNFQMQHNGGPGIGQLPFGGTCSIPVTVRRVFSYNPNIAITSPAVTKTSTLPADVAKVAPNEQLTLDENINDMTSPSTSPGDPYNWGMYVYSCNYQYQLTGTTDTSSCTRNPGTTTLATGSSAGPGPGTATGCGTCTASQDQYTTFTIPSGALDGTNYCFYSEVDPAYRIDTTDSGYSDSVGGGTGNGYKYKYRYSNVAISGSDNNTNVESSLSSGAKVSNDLCVEVENVRDQNLQVTGGDVHAGGNVGASCSTSTNATNGDSSLNGDLLGASGSQTAGGSDNGSYAQYVASASNLISGISNGSGSNNLTFGNGGTLGSYGVVCRPDMNTSAKDYISLHPLSTFSLASGTYNVANAPFTLNGIYKTTGPVTLYGVVEHQITIYDPNGYGVTIGGGASDGISYDSTPQAVNALPSFGVITVGGNINVLQIATHISGIYVAQTDASGVNGGIITTCSGTHVFTHANDCPSTLSVYGSMIANRFVFGRTGALTGPGSLGAGLNGNIVTENVQQSALLYVAPPPAFGTQPDTANSLPQYLGEGLPFY